MKLGLYDKLIDAEVKQALESLNDTGLKFDSHQIATVDLAARIGQSLGEQITRVLEAAPEKTRSELAIEVAEAVSRVLADTGTKIPTEAFRIAEGHESLDAIYPGQSPISKPLTPLSLTTLHTNADSEPRIGKELLAEIDSADRIDLVLAFIRWSGIRDMLEALRAHCSRGRPLRVITTIYTNSTEPRALEALANLGADIRVSYDTTNTRLHAKSWLFYRSSGYSSVYIGSSNLTFSAQATGLEWNVRATQPANPLVIEKFSATFETYWQSDQFKEYDPVEFSDASRSAAYIDDALDLTPFDIAARPYQAHILAKLVFERSRGHHQNLVVAATGTGKTIVAALDYKALRKTLTSSRLLFVAHRKEILKQSRIAFRHVLRDGSFGELWVDGNTPVEFDHVFASIQSLHGKALDTLDPSAFDVLIVDEFHHAMADTYGRLLDHFKPVELLGLTATPERADGKNTISWFDNRIAAELRIWHALEDGLLSPFHYYGVADNTDLTGIAWQRGAYAAEDLTNVYTADDLWVGKVIEALGKIVNDPKTMRGLGFCVSIRHAQFMAKKFNAIGIAAKAVSASTNAIERAETLKLLESNELSIVFSVDLYNEGVDIPSVDTLLMLRPTESATVFLQQLGRGLRKSEGKDVLTVLDFVGHHRKEFRFDQRFKALLGVSRRQLEEEITEDFPRLPPGCHIQLDRQAREHILKNVREALPHNVQGRTKELRGIGDVGLRKFLQDSMLELEEVYSASNYWTSLRRRAGFIEGHHDEDMERRIGRGIGRLLHIDDLHRLEWIREIAKGNNAPSVKALDSESKTRLQMLLLVLFSPSHSEDLETVQALDSLWRYPELRKELVQLSEVLQQRLSISTEDLGILGVPLETHATYSRDEIFAAFGASSMEKLSTSREGVYWHEETSTNLCFITLDKSDAGFSPTTRYKDFAISPDLFHWETQSTTSATSMPGRRYIEQKTNRSSVILFVREKRRDAFGNTAAFFCLGQADYVSHEGERPIAITWKLRKPIPGDRFGVFRAAVA